MKRISQTLTHWSKPVQLYLDDLQRIVEIFGEMSADVSISTEEYQFENIEEDLGNLSQQTINNLRIESFAPHILLELSPGIIWLYIFNDDAVSRGLFEKVKTVLHTCRRRASFLTNHHWLAAVPGGWAIVWLVATAGIEKEFSISTFFVLALSLFWGSLGYYARTKQHTIIHLKKRAELPSFWSRNKDSIILIIISSAVTSLFWAIMKWLA